MSALLSKIKSVISSIEPSVLSVISLAPFAIGIAVGYLLRGPIGLALDAVKLLVKLL